MKSLDLLDPTRPDELRFDPGSEQAGRVRAAAVARAETAPLSRTRRHRRLRLAPAFALAAAAAATGILLLTTGPEEDARAALQQAADRTAAVESGLIIHTLRGDPPGPARGVDRSELRFMGGDLEHRYRGRAVLHDGRKRIYAGTYREIGSDAYYRDDTRPGAEFDRELPTAETDFPHQLVRHVGSPALVALVRGADDFSAREAPGGATVYRATVTAGQVFDAAPTAAGRARGGAWDRPERLEVTVGENGMIERVVSAGATVTTTIEYRDLNDPQVIERPSPAELSSNAPPEPTLPPELSDRER